MRSLLNSWVWGGASGILCHGGTLASLTALLAARQRSGFGNSWKDGSMRPCAVMVSEQAHYCVDRTFASWAGAAGTVKVRTLGNHRSIQKLCKNRLRRPRLRNGSYRCGWQCLHDLDGTFDDLEMLAVCAAKRPMAPWMAHMAQHRSSQNAIRPR